MGQIHLYIQFDEENGEECEIDYTYTPGKPAIGPSFSHGGLPPDPSEIEITKMTYGNGKHRVDFDELKGAEQDRIYEAIEEHESIAPEPEHDID